MAVFRPQYKDKKTGETKHSRIWCYKFIFAGRLIKESAKTTSKTVAKEAEKRRRREMEEGFNGLVDSRSERVRGLRALAKEFLKDYRVRQPKSAVFAQYALKHIERLLGDLIAADVTDRVILRYQTDRMTEEAAPKTINEEVGFLLRLLPIAQAGAIRAQLKQQKRLKLSVEKKTGRAFSEEEKEGLTEAAKNAKRSRGILLATLLAQQAGLRDKEIRTLQWNRFDLSTRMLTVGASKTAAGTGRTIPMTDALHAAAVDYAKWYSERFGTAQPNWYLFPFGRPRPHDPTRPQTSMKTAWRNARSAAKVSGRFHDNRHTFVTDLAESGASDQVIQDLAGHVSRDMVKHYSHIRTEAKRRAVHAMSRKQAVEAKQKPQDSGALVQDSVQVTRPN